MSVHPARLAARFAPPLPETVAARLLAEGRFADRLDALLGARPEAEAADRRLLAMDAPTREALALRAGIVLHARALLREIRGPVIAALAARFGEEALAGARAHLDLAPEGGGMPDPDRIAADGAACLAAWLARLPPALHARAVLAWPDDDALPPAGSALTDSHGPAILRRLAEAA